MSDESSDLTSPLSSLPPETPTSPHRHSSNSRQTPTNFPYHSNSSQNQSPLLTPTNAPRATASSDSGFPTSCSDSEHFVSSGPNSPMSHQQLPLSPNHQPRPGSLALASLADSGVLSDSAGHIHRPGSLAAPCNTVGIPPAPMPTRAISASTGLNNVPSSTLPNSKLMFPTAGGGGKVNGTGLYTITQESSMLSLGAYDNVSSSGETHHSNDVNKSSNIPGTHTKQGSRIPMNRQVSSSSVVSNSSDTTSRIPHYGSPQPSHENHSRLPTMASNTRNYSNTNHNSVSNNKSLSGSKIQTPSGLKSPISKQIPVKESRIQSSRIPSSGMLSSPNTNISNNKANVERLASNLSAKSSALPSPHTNATKFSGIPTPGYNRSNSTLSNSEKGDGRRIPTPQSGGSFGKANVTSNSSLKSRIPSSSYSPNTSIDSTTNNSGKEYPKATSPVPQSQIPYGGGSNMAYRSPNSNGNAPSNIPYKSPPQNGISTGISYKNSSSYGTPSSGGLSYNNSGGVHPTQQAINTSGLPPAPSSVEARKSSGLPRLHQQSKLTPPSSVNTSRLPHYGGTSVSG